MLFKKLIISIWRLCLFLQVLIFTTLTSKKNKPKIFYGGARKGDIGGPMVKISKLSKFFEESNISFNIVYLTSNNSYLSEQTLRILKEKKIPIILNQNGVYYPEWFKGDYKGKNHINSYFHQFADYVLYQSKFSKKASEKYLGKRSGPGEILYNAVDTKYFLPKKNPDKYFTFLITGNIRKKSNYRILSIIYAISAIVNEYKNIKINIAGYIEDKNYLLSIIHTLSLEDKFTFLGKYSQKEAPYIYNTADAYITMAYNDNCPSAVLEAMSSGLPILYSASGGIPELVNKDSGIGLKVKENWMKTEIPKKSDIQDGIKKIIENKDNMSQSARFRAIEYFDIKNWITKHNEIFEKLLNDSYS